MTSRSSLPPAVPIWSRDQLKALKYGADWDEVDAYATPEKPEAE